jgi:hypothetical protein
MKSKDSETKGITKNVKLHNFELCDHSWQCNYLVSWGIPVFFFFFFLGATALGGLWPPLGDTCMAYINRLFT